MNLFLDESIFHFSENSHWQDYILKFCLLPSLLQVKYKIASCHFALGEIKAAIVEVLLRHFSFHCIFLQICLL